VVLPSGEVVMLGGLDPEPPGLDMRGKNVKEKEGKGREIKGERKKDKKANREENDQRIK